MRIFNQNVQIKEIKEKEIWEKFVLRQKYTSLFQSWNWGEFEKVMGNKFERYGIYDKCGELIGLIPVRYVNAVRGRYIHLRHGPIFNFDDEEVWLGFLHFIINKAKEGKYWFIRLSPLIEQDLELKYALIFSRLRESQMHNVDAEITWVLNLDKSEENLLKNMRKNTRYYIRKAVKDGVKVEKGTSGKKLNAFLQIYRDTVLRQKWNAYSDKYIINEVKAFLKDDMVRIFLAKYKNKYIAGAIVVFYGDQAIYHHGGTLSKYLKIPASYIIQWEAIREAKSRGKKWYNFWGISPLVMEDGEYRAKAGHPWEGLTFFKLGFGGQIRQFVHAKDLQISWQYKLTRFFEKLEKLRRGY